MHLGSLRRLYTEKGHKRMAKCDFLDYRGGILSGGYYCMKKGDYIDKNTANSYCDNSLKYRDCPIYRGSSGSSGCYLTTACVEQKGLSDDCIELSVLREFRDGYIASLPNGNEEIMEYYKTAPQVVRAINQRDDADGIYETLYNETITPCVEMIQGDRKEEAYIAYKQMVEEMKDLYW